MVKREGGHPNGHKVEWWGGISLGNLLTIVGGIVVAGIAWGAVTTTQAQQQREIEAVESRSKERVDELRQDMRRIEDKLDRIADKLGAAR